MVTVSRRWFLVAVLAAACGGTIGNTSPGDGGRDGGAPDATIDAATDSSTAMDAQAGGDLAGLCPDVGTYCGGHMVAGDPSTLYYCGGAGMPPSSSMPCTAGCMPSNGTAGDGCKVPTMMNGPICRGQYPGPYCGNDMVDNGDPSTLYECPGQNMPPTSAQKCNNGCSVEPSGTPDYCKGAITCNGSLAGDYCGNDSITGGDPNTLYHCPGAGQAPSGSMPCASGCQVNPMGMNDVCRSGTSCPGVGAYCGGDGVQGGDAGTLYQCPGAGQPASSSSKCQNGCTIEPAGTPDFCTPTLKCPTNGDYCGNDGLGGPSNVLFHCSAGGQPPSSSTTCASGCLVMAQGVPDICAGSGCTATGSKALSWEANQLNTGHSWSDVCLGFVNSAYTYAGNSPWWLHASTANNSLNQARTTGKFVNWNGTCPCGAVLYWAANNCNLEDGHVVICNGDGTVSTSGWPGFGGSTHASITWLDGEECGHTPAGYILP